MARKRNPVKTKTRKGLSAEQTFRLVSSFVCGEPIHRSEIGKYSGIPAGAQHLASDLGNSLWQQAKKNLMKVLRRRVDKKVERMLLGEKKKK